MLQMLIYVYKYTILYEFISYNFICLYVDDDQYVKNRKVSKKKLKPYEADSNIYELFACDKPCTYTVCTLM